MRLKTLLLAILLLPPLTQIGYAQTPQELQNRQNSGFGIEPNLSYPGTLVLDLMQAAEAEIEAAVAAAYEEGYKAAMLRFSPELSALRASVKAMQVELGSYHKKQRWFWPIAGGAAAASFAAGFFTRSLPAR